MHKISKFKRVSTMSSFFQVSLFLVMTVTFLLPSHVASSNILFFHSFVTSSHRTAIWPLAEKLADQGHNVTYIFPLTKKIGFHPKIEELTPSKLVPIMTAAAGEFDINLRIQHKEYEWIEGVMSVAVKLCEAFYDSPEIQEWLARPSLAIDVVFLDSSLGECGYGLVHKFDAKLIHFMPVLPQFLFDAFGLVPESSSIPDMMAHPKPTEMTLYSRTISTLVPLIWRYKFLEYVSELEHLVWKKLNMPSTAPSFLEIEQSTSLVLISSSIVEEYPMALPPMFVSFSGLWCSKDKLQDRKPLPEKMTKFLDKSDGFIYVSFGSAVVASAMPLELRNHFFQAFRKFPNFRFFWRWTGPVPENFPENAMLLPWFPQQDILAHPKIKGFLTQAGRPSTQEALCYGVPLITVPIFADQDYNADRLEYVGAAINLNIDKLTETELSTAFNEILHNPKHAEKTKELSSMFRDRPIDALENVLYWTEYVLRYSKEELSILKPLSMKQTWYQRRLLDVYALLFVIALGLVGIILMGVVIIFKLILRVIIPNVKGKTKKE